MWDRRDAYRAFVENLKEGEHLEVLGVNGRLIPQI
jgi:hypothetical protein